MNISDILAYLNTILTHLDPIFWIVSNILVGYVTLMAIVFSVAYPIYFRPRATTVGRVVLMLMISLATVTAQQFIAVFVDPAIRNHGSFFGYPDGLYWWRSIVRFLSYAYVAYASTSLVHVLWLRKFRPERMTIAPDTSMPVKVRKLKLSPRLIKLKR